MHDLNKKDIISALLNLNLIIMSFLIESIKNKIFIKISKIYKWVDIYTSGIMRSEEKRIIYNCSKF